MLTFGSGMNDESIFFDHEWSLQKTTKLLSDESLYSTTEMFNYTEPNSSCDTPHKMKCESVTDLLPAEAYYNEWQTKCIDLWESQDCLLWLIHELQDLKVSHPLTEVKMELMAHMNGKELKNMSIDYFNKMFPSFGSDLFYRLQKLKACYSNIFTYGQWSSPAEILFPRYMSQEPTVLTDLDCKSHSVPLISNKERDGYKSDTSMEAIVPVVPEKRRPGRPRGTKKKKKPEKLGRLWEFIRDLLLNPQYNPSMICWENYDEGMFRFVHSDRVAKLWGSKKENEDMNYEKLSRAMRYYYKSQVLLPVYGKRLVYKFGPTATGWRSENPIMRCRS